MADENILYHYCSNDAFCSIINNKTVRLSSLRLSNDRTEGTVVSKVFEALAADDPERVDGFSSYVKELESPYHALGFCLSEADDLLSQWRGYADDGAGFSIGFSREYLESFAEQEELCCQIHSGRFLKVEYDLKKQKELLRSLYEKMKYPAARGGIELPVRGSAQEINRKVDAFRECNLLKMMVLAPELYGVKDEPFSEEVEWRIVVPLREMDLTNYGCHYRMRGGQLVPYKDIAIKESAIMHVIIGPKNPNSEQDVKCFLESQGFGKLHVTKSEIPYC